MPIEGVALIRVSTAGQADESKAGIPAQREAVRRICQTWSINVAKEHHFELTDVSGASVLMSQDYQRFLQAVARQEITAVVTKEFSRLMRPERLDDYLIIQYLWDHGITLYTPEGKLDLSKPLDRFMATIRAGMAGMERLEIRQRMMDAKETMRRQGRHPSSPGTLAHGIGYDKKTGWFYKDDEIQIVRLLFQWFLEGEHSYERLAARSGIPRSTIRNLLVNPVYAGVMTYRTKHDLSPAGQYPQKKGKRAYRRKVARVGDEVIRVPLPPHLQPVITMEQHELIVELVEKMRFPRARARSIAIPRFTYRGYLRCGSCRQGVYSWVGGRRKDGSAKDFYYCQSRSPRERAKREASGELWVCGNRYMIRSKLEDAIDHALVDHLAEPGFLRRIIDAYMQQAEEAAVVQQARALSQQLDRLAGKRDRVIDLYEDGNIDRFEKQLRLSKIDDQVDEIERLLSTLRSPRFEPQQIQQVVSVFAEWPFLGMDGKRRLMERMLPEIYVDCYAVKGVTLRLGCNNVNPPPEVAGEPPEHYGETPEVRPERVRRCVPC